jgi:arylsulfatase A-like enzyme
MSEMQTLPAPELSSSVPLAGKRQQERAAFAAKHAGLLSCCRNPFVSAWAVALMLVVFGAATHLIAADQPDILLIMPDQMRGDCLSLLGHPVVRTPQLDELARQGTLFRRAYSTVPSCIPARYALLTGTAPQTSGVVGFAARPITTPTLPGALADAGYATVLVGRNMHQAPKSGDCGYQSLTLVPVLRGAGRVPREWLHFEHAPCYSQAQAFHALTDGHFKYIWRPQDGAEQLFDLDRDPYEEQDLSKLPAVEAWRQRLIHRLAARPEGFSDGQHLVPGRPYPPLQKR